VQSWRAEDDDDDGTNDEEEDTNDDDEDTDEIEWCTSANERVLLGHAREW